MNGFQQRPSVIIIPNSHPIKMFPDSEQSKNVSKSCSLSIVTKLRPSTVICEDDEPFIDVETVDEHIQQRTKYENNSIERPPVTNSDSHSFDQSKSTVPENHCFSIAAPPLDEVALFVSGCCQKKLKLSSDLKQCIAQYGKPKHDYVYCAKCGQPYASKETLTQHLGIRRRRRNCGTEFRKWRQVPENRVKMPGSSDQLQCLMCGRQYHRLINLQQHILHVHMHKRYRCSRCLHASSVRHSMVKHLRRHTGERPFECKTCKSTFKGKGSLRHHRCQKSIMPVLEPISCDQEPTLLDSQPGFSCIHPATRKSSPNLQKPRKNTKASGTRRLIAKGCHDTHPRPHPDPLALPHPPPLFMDVPINIPYSPSCGSDKYSPFVPNVVPYFDVPERSNRAEFEHNDVVTLTQIRPHQQPWFTCDRSQNFNGSQMPPVSPFYTAPLSFQIPAPPLFRIPAQFPPLLPRFTGLKNGFCESDGTGQIEAMNRVVYRNNSERNVPTTLPLHSPTSVQHNIEVLTGENPFVTGTGSGSSSTSTQVPRLPRLRMSSPFIQMLRTQWNGYL